ncbi:coniferyl aldehyde dehydrogenase [Vibrio hepatarius]|uniref:coniferyl aldehyde dehydrogenase n=1 Tax=Vibrio hepatarius TaxID=171383 RepID=UPI001C0A4D90|nr:coniferyl aldehyde dehydrogenase [Vibrio hepatarius]MBU2896697.1 coniferyl aldehyde dehydrogenase [Vibrio hepatarius]
MEDVVDFSRWQKEHIRTEEELYQLYAEVKTYYQSEPCSSYRIRIERLKTLKRALVEHQEALIESLSLDYGLRSRFDSLICDLLPAIKHISFTIKHLKQWMKPSRRKSGLLLFPSSVRVEYQPLGVVGVIVPWNFPIVLSIAPIVTAIAAGNRVMVKLSEHTHHTNQVLSNIFTSVGGHIYPVEGEVDISSYFSKLPFDHLIFTGSTPVGKLVAQAAAKNLTPVTLELGGKSPVIIDNNIDLRAAVDAVLFGKSVNSGQICVSPDYVLLPTGKEQMFVELYLKRYQSLYLQGNEATSITHIINPQQYNRLSLMLEDARSRGAGIHTIEHVELEQGQMLPHLITGVTEHMQVMQQEIFGPILPVIGYRRLNEALSYINFNPRPLALYLMSTDKVLQRQVIEQTHSGGIAINDTLLQVAIEDAPFGGIGASGIGQYHGKEGFLTFSKAKTILYTPAWLPRSTVLLRYRKTAEKILGTLFIR